LGVAVCGLAAIYPDDTAGTRAQAPATSGAAQTGLDLSPYAPGYGGVVFTEIPAARGTAAEPSGGGVLRAPYGDGGRLVLLARNGTTRVLTQEFESAADPALSFDGKRMLFAGKRTAGDLWNIFEMNSDGSGIRQITRNAGNCRSPMYQSALFYLNDARPSYQITFVSDSAGELNEYGRGAATNLYSVRFDGSGLRRLTYGVSSSYDPFQMQDGRILFSNWQRSHLGYGIQGRIDLFAIHLDGADYAAFSGAQGRRFKQMACTTPQRMVAFIESDALPWDGAGTVGTLSLRRNLHSYKAVTTATEGLFHSPSPLPDGSILISRRPSDGQSVHAIYRLDLETGRRTLVFREVGYHSIQAVVLVPRPEPDGHSSVVEDDQNWAKLYGLSVYENDLKREWMPPGTARRIRVLEGLPRPTAAAGETPSSRSEMIPKRLLGDVALDKDGSFHLQVPPNTPIQLQVVDADGMALRTSAWIWAKNKEQRGCIGCHEDNERTPENVFAQALGHPAAELTLPPERRRTVDFLRDVKPILSARCSNAACHGAAAQPVMSYEQLLTKAATARPGGGNYVDPGSARTSRLVWAILGRNTARPWDRTGPAPTPRRMPPAGSPPLKDDEQQTLIEWIDLGAMNSRPSGASGGQR
jgi:hypothetical protein